MNWTLFFIIVSFAAYILVGWVISKKIKNSTQYLTMGRNASTFYTTGTIVASYLASMAFISTFSTGYLKGMSYSIVQYGCLATFMVVAFLVGPRIYRSGTNTIPEFFKMRYCSERIRTLTSILMIVACTAFNISCLSACGVALGAPLGISNQAAVIISGIVIMIFSTMGGMWGVVVTDTMMFVIFFLAVGVGWPIAVTHAGSEPIASVVAKINELLPGSFALTGYTPLTGSKYVLGQDGFLGWMLPTFLVSASLGLGGAQVLSRVFIPKNTKTVAKSFILAQVLLCFFLMLLMSTAPFIRVLAPEDLQPTQGYLWLIENYFPTFLKGFVLAGIAAAGLSTSSTLLQNAASSLANDIYVRHLMKDKASCSDAKALKISKIFMGVCGLITIVLCLYQPVADLMIFYSFIFAAGLFTCWIPALLYGTCSKRANEKAAFWSILVSMIAYLVNWVLNNFFHLGLPHQIYIAIILSFGIMIVMTQKGTPTEEMERAFWRMQTKSYKKEHHYVDAEA